MNRKNLYENLEQIKKFCPNIFAMVKANAYGHGVKNVCKLLYGKVDFFGVACLEEALEIRKFDKRSNILIVGICKDIFLAIKNNISFTIENLDDFKGLLKFIKKHEKLLKNHKKIAKIHIKINSGMNRLGFNEVEEFKKLLNIYFKFIYKKYIKIEGVFTHFASRKQLKNQVYKFKEFLSVIPSLINPIIHIGGGIGKYAIKEFENAMLRVGIDLYTNPCYVLTISSEIIKVFSVKAGEYVGYDNGYKTQSLEKIAVVPLGYADGINRKVSGEFVTINKRRYKIVGNICMDMFFVKVDESVKRGDTVKINFEGWAEKCGTIPYEILTSIKHRRMKDLII